jgi:hypothetical protein
MFLSTDSGAVLCISRRGKIVTLSSTDAEIDALCECLKEVIWVRGFLAELGFPQTEPTVIFQDNKSTITLSNMISILPRTRYLANRLNFIRQEIQKFRIATLMFIPSTQMVADILTKGLPRKQYEYLCNLLLTGHNGVGPTTYATTTSTIIINKTK